MHAYGKAAIAFLLVSSAGVVPAAGQKRNALTPLLSAWKVVGVDVADAPVQAVVRDDPTLLGAVLEVTPTRLSWRSPHRNTSLDANCDAPRLIAGAIRCRNGSFAPPGARLTQRGNSLTLPWYDGATLRLSRERPGTSAPALTTSGYGGIRLGSRLMNLRGYTLTDKRTGREECSVTGIREVPGLALLATNGVIQRISIGENGPSPVKTDRGIGFGSTQAAVQATYRPLRVRPHKYVDRPASDLTWLANDGKRGLRFETGQDRRVKVIHAGLMPELGYVERCG